MHEISRSRIGTDLLAYVIQHREVVVSKNDLIAAIWAGRVVSESALTTRINAARTSIGDTGEQQRPPEPHAASESKSHPA